MKIEIAKEGRMDMSGQGLIRAIQNNNMPILDLLVRESVQNSLDAAEKSTDFVQVDFGVSSFDSNRLAGELEGIEETLSSRFGSRKCKYLYIRDSKTIGLTGPLHFTDKNSAEKKNLLKLVYEIAKPQDEKGAGGSWGYGKTIYFRIGIGLVIYYSRIKQETGEYQSRLAACLVEDENREDAILSNPSLDAHRGLAWWGAEYFYKSNGITEFGTIPETDDKIIEHFLSIFGIKPFEGDETGTAIIIPYIDEKKLLSNNISEENRSKIPWHSSVEEYLKIATQRWYIGRLNNPDYQKKQKQPWLRVTVNGRGLAKDDMAKPFVEMQKLYNMALLGERTGKDIPVNDYHCEPINISKYFAKTTSGFIAYKMYTSEEMEMNPPYNNPSPFIFVKNEDGEDDYKGGDIIFTFFRKPGMSVNYDTAGEWVNKIKCNNEKTGDILIAVFVLDSSNRFSYPGIDEVDTIEEYFRASEKADHTAWYDISVNDINPRILDKIQKGIRKKINNTFVVKEKSEEKESSSLSQMFGEFLLPPEGFGKKAKGKKGSSGKGNGTVKHKNVKLTVNNKRVSALEGKITLPVTFEAATPINGVDFILEVAADGKNIPLENWMEKTGISVPFNIAEFEVKTIQSQKSAIDGNITINSANPVYRSKVNTINLLINATGDIYGIHITSECQELLVSGELKISVADKTAQMSYQLKGGE